MYPDFLVALTVSPQIAIKRRGGEGHLVNEDYITKYNCLFTEYYKNVNCKKCIVDTGEMDIYEMNDFLYNIILKNLP